MITRCQLFARYESSYPAAEMSKISFSCGFHNFGRPLYRLDFMSKWMF